MQFTIYKTLFEQGILFYYMWTQIQYFNNEKSFFSEINFLQSG